MENKNSKPLKGLMVSVYTNATYKGCSNGGISERCKNVVVVGEGIDEVFTADESMPAVKLVKRVICGEVVVHAEPIAALNIDPVASRELKRPVANCGFMAGGAYIASCDSRFGAALRKLGYSSYCAISLHDRQEDWETYNALSR